MERLRHLPVRTSPSAQDAWPHGVTYRVGRPHAKKKAARRSSGRKKVLQCSLHCHVKTAHCLRCWHVSTRFRLHLHDGLR